MARSAQATITLSERQLENVIRKIVRQVVREEFQRAFTEHPEVIEKWMLNPKSPLYHDMVALRREIRAGKVKLLSEQEVWGA